MQSNVPTVAIVGIVARKDIKQRTHASFENVSRSARIQFHATAVRTHANDATGAQLQLAPIRSFRLHKTKIPNRTINPAIDPEFDSVGTMVRRTVLESESNVPHQ